MSQANPYDGRRPAALRRSRTGAPQLLARLIGAVYLLIGVAGFFVTGFGDFVGTGHGSLLGFSINPLHNAVHIVIGVAGLVMGSTLGTARGYGALLAIGYGATFVYGLFAAGRPDIDILNLNAADNVLHALSTLAGLAIFFWPGARDEPAATARLKDPDNPKGNVTG